jgi:hypothetical protein
VAARPVPGARVTDEPMGAGEQVWGPWAAHYINVLLIAQRGTQDWRELHENEMRKDFTVSERVAIGKALEAYLGSRQGQRTDKELQAILPEVEHGKQTRNIAAEKPGFGSTTTYRQAKQVVDHAEPELVDAVDTGALPVSQAAKVVDAEPEVQRQVADLAQQGKRKETREAIRQAHQTAHPAGSVEASWRREVRMKSGKSRGRGSWSYATHTF